MKQVNTIIFQNHIKSFFGFVVLCCFTFCTSQKLLAQTCNTAPVIVCPQNFFGCPSDDTSTANTGVATASPGEAACPQPVITYTEQIMDQGPCSGELFLIRTWKADYPSGANPWLFSDCNQVIILLDEEEPIIANCPSNITISPDANCEAVVTWNEPTPTDDCDVVTFVSSHANGSSFPLGTTTVTYTATDICGKTAACSFDVVVAGSCCFSAPIVNCPDTYLGCPDSDIHPDNTGYPSVSTASSNCSTPIVTYEDTEIFTDSYGCNQEKFIYRHWKATDPHDADLFTICEQVIWLYDSNHPAIVNCPSDILVSDGDTATWTAPEASNRCGITSFTSNYSSGYNFDVGCTSVIYTAVDYCGRTSSCSFEVCVEASEICESTPVIICPQNFTGCPSASTDPSNTGSATATNNGNFCNTPVLTFSDELVNTSNGVEIHRVWTATESSQNSIQASCVQIIITNDTNAPVITNCPENIFTTGVNCTATWNIPSFVDNCGEGTITSNYQPGDTFPTGTTTVTYTATDPSGNTSTCSFEVICSLPTCQTNPVIVCPTDYLACPGGDITPSMTGSGTATPGSQYCGTPIISYNDVLNTTIDCTENAGIWTRTWTATDPDNSNLTSSCNQVIMLSDNDNPVLSNCPSDIVLNNGNCTATWTPPTAVDNCGIQSLVSNFDSGHTFPTGNTTVTYTATDNCGNTATCSFTVTCNAPVVCEHNPLLTCPDFYIGCPTDDISPNNTGWPIAMPGSNICATPLLSFNDQIVNTFSCNGAVEITRTWTATDPSNSNLTSSCDQTIILKDDQAPQFTSCPNNITLEGNSCIANWIEPTVWDNCGLQSLSSNHPIGYTFPNGTTTVTYTAIDNCGNIATCSFTVTCTAPTPICQSNPVIVCPQLFNGCPNGSIDASVTGTATANPGGAACGSPVVTSSDQLLEDFNCAGAKKWLRTWTATDSNNSNFSSSCTQIIMLTDDNAPHFSNCPQDIVLTDGNCTATWNTPTALDDCGIQNVTSNFSSGHTFLSGTTTVTYVATDNCGNTASCSFTVTCNAITGGNLEVNCSTDLYITCDNQNGANTCWDMPTYQTDCSICNQGNIPGFIYMGTLNGHQYYCSLEPQQWLQANQDCQNYGGYLAVINSAQENNFLASMLTLQSAYIGLSDYQSEGNFVWADGSPLSYTNWYPGQPNNYNGAQDYCEMLSNGQWNDQYFHTPLEYIMEIPCVTITQTSGPANCSYAPVGNTTVNYTVEDLCGNVETCSFDIIVEEGLSIQCVEDAVINCPAHSDGVAVTWQEPVVNSCCSVCYEAGGGDLDGFMYMGSYGGSHYYCSTFPATWPEAQVFCKESGGNLAIIEDEGENSFLGGVLTLQSAYVGCSDAEEEGHFVWVDGSGIEYSNWYPGQPNNYNDAQDYVEILSNGQWNDQYNGKALEFIMEVDGCVSIKQIAGPPNGSYLPLGCTDVTYEATDACGNIEYCSFNLCVQADYCQSGGIQSQHSWIKNVTFNDINNTSGSDGGYANNTNICTSVAAGYQYGLGLMPGFPGAPSNVYWKVYIDYNQDGDFYDTSEFIATGSGSQILSGNITIPSWVTTGNTTMRVVMKKGSMPDGPCTVFGYGETEDYCIQLWGAGDADDNENDSTKSRVSNTGKEIKPAKLAFDGFVFTEEREARVVGDIKTIEVFPNPSADYIQVNIEDIERVSEINVFTNNGTMIEQWKGSQVAENNRKDIRNWVSGMYLLSIEFNDGTKQVKKVIKQE